MKRATIQYCEKKSFQMMIAKARETKFETVLFKCNSISQEPTSRLDATASSKMGVVEMCSPPSLSRVPIQTGTIMDFGRAVRPSNVHGLLNKNTKSVPKRAKSSGHRDTPGVNHSERQRPEQCKQNSQQGHFLFLLMKSVQKEPLILLPVGTTDSLWQVSGIPRCLVDQI